MNELWSKNKAIILFGTLVLAVVAPLSVVADWDGQCRSSNGGVCDYGWYRACHGVDRLRTFLS